MSVIYLLPLNGVENGLVQDLASPLRRAFHAEIVMMSGAVSVDEFYDEKRHQYNSTEILRYVKGNFSANDAQSTFNPSHTNKHLVITAEDLFIPILTFVFGEAELGGNVAVVSYYRLLNERYGLPPNRALLSERLQKEAIHELGHAFGLVHCHFPECVMRTSTYVEDIDLKREIFCDGCRTALQRAANKT